MSAREQEGRATRTPRTWGENVWPTAQQLADWLKVCTEAERVTHAYIAIRDAQAHDRCLSQHQPAPPSERSEAWLRGYEFALRNLHDEPVRADLQRLTAGVNAGPDVSHASNGADDAPDEAKGALRQQTPAPAVVSTEDGGS